MAVYLTTTPQIIGKNESNDIHVYLYGWYSNQTGNTCTVHAKLTIISTTQTYADASKTYLMVLGGYNSGTQSWSYEPIETDVEYVVTETTWTYAEGNEIQSQAVFWVNGIGSIDVNLSDNTFVEFSTPPSDLNVTLGSVGSTEVELSASISSYGNYQGTPDKYIAVGVFNENNWHNPSLSSNYSADSLSDTFTIENYDLNTGGYSPLVPNTQYYYGGAATNGEESVSQMFGQFVTRTDGLTIMLTSRDSTSATFEYSLEADGGYYSKSLQYDIDSSDNWTTFATISSGDPIYSATTTINNISPYKTHLVEFRILTPAGSSTISQIHVPSLSTKLYGSVEVVPALYSRKLIDNLYGSVSNQAKPIIKLYGSADNKAVLLHQYFGHANYNQ